jgi:competence protein ComEC
MRGFGTITHSLAFLLALLLLPLSGCTVLGSDPGRATSEEVTAPEVTPPRTEAQPRAHADSMRAPAPDATAPLLTLRFLDVGQGDAVLIRAPTGQSVLYDGGDRGSDIVRRLREQGVTELTLVIASHNHADHIGGLSEVIRAFRPAYVMENGLPHTTRTYERFLEAIEAAGSQLLEAERRTIRLGDAELLIIPPSGRSSWGQNDNSVGVLVQFGSFRASLMGDAEHRQFGWWLQSHSDIFQPVQVHKASHHGSRNGDTPGALRALRPEVVVIGLGLDNSYGHPHHEALSRYRQLGAKICRTDVHGDITIEASRTGNYSLTTENSAAGREGELDCI